MIEAKSGSGVTDEGGSNRPQPRRMLNEAQVLAVIPISRDHALSDVQVGPLSKRNIYLTEPARVV